MNKKELATKIRMFRAEKRMSQTTLSKKSGISRATISSLESGNVSVGYDVVYSILDALGKKIEVANK